MKRVRAGVTGGGGAPPAHHRHCVNGVVGPAQHRTHLTTCLPLSFSFSRSWQEKPKSVSLMFMSSSRRMFSGFRSRWTMSMEWRYWITSSSARMIFLGMGDSTSASPNTPQHPGMGPGTKELSHVQKPQQPGVGTQPGGVFCSWVLCQLQGSPLNLCSAFAARFSALPGFLLA